MKTVLIVEDSATAALLLKAMINSDSQLTVVACVGSGEEALRYLERHPRPDLITMDICLPGMDGFSTIQAILQQYPIPIVVVSSLVDKSQTEASFEALRVGALGLVPKPHGPGHPEHLKTTRTLLRTLRTMAEVPVVTRKKQAAGYTAGSISLSGVSASSAKRLDLLLIGASTGGPPIIQQILASLPVDFPGCVLIVQHIAAGFESSMVDWLQHSCALPITLAVNGARLTPGTVSLAPAECFMSLASDGTLRLQPSPHSDVRGTVDHLFLSAANTDFAPQSLALLLTGMGRDGAEGLLKLRQNGALTVAQDQASCTVYGMPAVAAQLNAATHILSPGAVIDMLPQWFSAPLHYRRSSVQ